MTSSVLLTAVAVVSNSAILRKSSRSVKTRGHQKDKDPQWNNKFGFGIMSWKLTAQERSQKISFRCFTWRKPLIDDFSYYLGKSEEPKTTRSSEVIHSLSFQVRSYQLRRVEEAFWRKESSSSRRTKHSILAAQKNTDTSCDLVWWWTSSRTYRCHFRYILALHLSISAW